MKKKIFLCVTLCALLVISITAMSKIVRNESDIRLVSKEVLGTDDSPKTVDLPEYKSFQLRAYSLSFDYPREWVVRQKGANEFKGSLCTTIMYGKSKELVIVEVFTRPQDVESFVKSELPLYKESGLKDLAVAKSTVSGCDGYSWITRDNRGQNNGGAIVFSNEKYLFVLNFVGMKYTESAILDVLVNSLSAGGTGPTALAFSLPDTLKLDEGPSYASVSCCGLTDSYTNAYPCCDPYGNCTWYCEYRIAGNNNFPWYGDAYMWINSNSLQATPYAVGGTIPKVGAIMVFDSGWYTSGHVAYVTGINANGSITVDEQGCDAYCTRTGTTYTTAQLRSYLAGYLYPGGAPTPTAKAISGTLNVQTVIHDFPFSNVYNFQAYGPGNNKWGWLTYNGGDNSFFHYTNTTTTRVNYGRWRFSIGTAGNYKIEAFVPNIHATANVRYYLTSTATLLGTIDQNQFYNEYKQVTASRNFAVGTYDIYVYDDLCSGSGTEIAFDSIRFTKL